jgi:hypothetical protein
VPVGDLPAWPTVDVFFNEQLIEHIVPDSATITRTWTLATRSDSDNVLQIRTSQTFIPSDANGSSDAREIGLRLDQLLWQGVG